MIYILLNVVVVLGFAYLTNYVDKKLTIDSAKDTNALAIPAIIVLAESIIFLFVVTFKSIWVSSIVGILMKIVFLLDGFFFVSISFELLGLATNIKNFFIRLIRYALYVFVAYVVFFKFTSITVEDGKGIMIGAEYIFSGEAREFFPWTWVTVYTSVIRFAVPLFCYLFMALIHENNKISQLQRFQDLIIGEALLLLWAMLLSINFISDVNSDFSYLFLYSYLFMFLLIISGLTKTSVPSGKGVGFGILRILLAYIIPAFIVAAFVLYIQANNESFSVLQIFQYVIAGSVGIFISMNVYGLFSSSRIYTADYSTVLEIDFAQIDYGTDMDSVTKKVFELLRRNAECSSMCVYIDNGHGQLDTAYSSNGTDFSIANNNPIFDVLLNINKSVVIYNEVDKQHDLSIVEDELFKFFADTKSDVVFLLNEGHNLLGVITLGIKLNGDHYKEYDYNVFTRLYSYFFTFGYFMRNIANKDVIGVVNREIRMSSQIITSIQENMDQIHNPKADVGYLMVPAHNIGGEFIDLIRLTDTRHLIVIGDLSGRGIAASMNMVILKSIIRTYLAETHDFRELVVKINTFVRDSLKKGTVFAGLFALIDFETDTMYYINCGIPALMVYTQVYNNVIEIQGSGHVLGFVKDISPYISVKTTKLNRGDIILACTDGLVQSHSLRGEQFGKERIQQAVLDNSTYPAQRMAQFTFDSLTKFMSKEMEDDVSIFVMKYESSREFINENEEKTQTEESSVESERIISESESKTEENSEILQNESQIETEEKIISEENQDENSVLDFAALAALGGLSEEDANDFANDVQENSLIQEEITEEKSEESETIQDDSESKEDEFTLSAEDSAELDDLLNSLDDL